MAGLGLLHYQSASDLRQQEIEAEMQEQEERRRMLVESSLASHIRRSWEDAKAARRDIDYRLLDCLRRRKGVYDPSKLANIRKEGGSEIYMMLTATKCRAAAAWIRDILMPVNEKPWGLSPTPVAEVPDAYLKPMIGQIRQQALELQQQGQQVDMAQLMEQAKEQIRQAAQEAAEKAAERHEVVIDDQLAEGGWDEALEAFIDDFVTFPSAFIRGPVLVRKPTLAWREGWQPIKVSEIQPQFVRVSPFDVYPSPDSTTTQDGAYLIERARFTRGQLNEMLGVAGYSDDSIRTVLREYGQGGLRDWIWNDGEREELEGKEHQWSNPGGTIDGLIYYGGAQGTTLLQWGVNPDDVPDPLAEYEVEAILIGNYVIRAKINRDPLERRPINGASFQGVPGSFWGTAIPELMSDVQDVCNATARGLVNNLAISSGPQVEVYEDRLEATEDPSDIYPWKVWRTKEGALASNNPAIRFFQPNSNAGELLTVYDTFERKADDATNIPRYIYGNEGVGGAGETASGLSMLMESANKGIKDAIRHIDRGVIRMAIEALWLHNMQYSSDNSIKGDASVVARGSSAMLMREQTNQLRSQFLQLTGNELDMSILGREARRRLLDTIAERLDMPGIVPTKEEMERQAAQQAEQAQVQQQLSLAKLQAEIAERQGKAQKYGADVAKTQADAQHTQAETAKTQSDTQISQAMAPLEAQKLLMEIMSLLNQAQGATNGTGRAQMEGHGAPGVLPRGQGAARVPGGAPGGVPRFPGADTRGLGNI